MNVVITGASKGIGKAIAKIFAGDKQGHTLFICARSKAEIQETAKELQGLFPNASIFCKDCDVSNAVSLKDFADFIFKQTNRIDILINNAGIFYPGSIKAEREGSLQKMIEVNLYGAYNLTRLILPIMLEQKSGHIFNVCSIASLTAYANGGSYSISKYAMYGFSKNLREELKHHGIKVTHVLPGAVYTNSWSESDIDPQRIMEADDIAKMVYAAAHLSPQACVEEIVIRPQLGDL